MYLDFNFKFDSNYVNLHLKERLLHFIPICRYLADITLSNMVSTYYSVIAIHLILVERSHKRKM